MTSISGSSGELGGLRVKSTAGEYFLALSHLVEPETDVIFNLSSHGSLLR